MLDGALKLCVGMLDVAHVRWLAPPLRAEQGRSTSETVRCFSHQWCTAACGVRSQIHLSLAGTFDLLVYTDSETSVPTEWEESDPRYISNSTEVRLRSFTTKIHKVDTCVSYKDDADDC